MGTLKSKTLYRFLSKRKKSATEIPSKEKALLALKLLTTENLPEQKLFDRYYVKLTGIVRNYIEEVFNIDAPESTTEEFLAAAANHPQFSPQTRTLLESFLQEADMVKFARQQSTLENCTYAHEAAVQFVENRSS